MIDYSNLPRDQIICLDFKAFYASVEAVSLGLDPLKCLLVVVSDLKRPGSVILASSPAMKKKYRIKTGNRLFEVPADPEIHVVEARMQHYLDVSTSITRLLNRFAPFDAIHTYSIDESFININNSEKILGTPWEAAQKIRDAILCQFSLPVCIGIGPNKLLSKLILDIYGKREGISECQYEDVPHKLWPVPIREMWGIGSRMERNLNRIGIRTIGHLANFSKDALKKKFGIIGEQLYYHANGVDLSPSNYNPAPERKGFGHGITLLRDYTGDEVKIIMLELAEEVARRAREEKLAGRTIGLSIGYSKNQVGAGLGFSRSRSVDYPTNITMDIYKVCLQLLKENYQGYPVRHVHVSLSSLSSDEVVQLSLFDSKEKQRNLGYVMDQIRDKYGSSALLRAVSYTPEGTSVYRVKTVGGHKA